MMQPQNLLTLANGLEGCRELTFPQFSHALNNIPRYCQSCFDFLRAVTIDVDEGAKKYKAFHFLDDLTIYRKKLLPVMFLPSSTTITLVFLPIGI